MPILQVKKREILGKKSKSLRHKGLIPAELYGRDFPNLHLAVAASAFLKIFKEAGESALIKLKIEEEKDQKKGEEKEIDVLIHDVAHHPLSDEILNIDFYRVRLDEKITTAIPLQFTGVPRATKEKGGILVKAMQEVEIEALPLNLPQNIEVDVSGLDDIGRSVYIKDIKTPPGVKLLVDPETVIATVTAPVKEEVVEKPISVEEVKVEGEEKKEEKEMSDEK